jgi:pimeloyl-ACP methyl ester carboxylesterase
VAGRLGHADDPGVEDDGYWAVGLDLPDRIEGFFDSNGVRLHYIDWRGSGRNLILLGGLGGTARLYGSLAPRLTDHFRVASFTRRAHGRSDRPSSGYDIDTLVEDIRRFFAFLGVEIAVLAGHSWAGIEIPVFASKYPQMVEAAVYFDALHVMLEPALDLSNDPALAALQTQPTDDDLASRESYLAFVKRSRPDLASIWCDAIEADRVEYLRMFARHGPAVSIVSKMDEGLGAAKTPDYGAVLAPSLAFVLGGKTHPFVAHGASDDFRAAADAFYVQNFVPRIQRRTQLFRDAVPNARIVELGTSNHTMFVAKEDETVAGIRDFLR